MTDVPERIWILRKDAMMSGKYQTVGGLEQVWVGDDGVEYVRAEAARALVELRLPIERKVGMRGSAFDGPHDARAYTYKHQPGNGPAWRLGEAAGKTAQESAGDYIDRGLALLRHLQDAGFGVFALIDDEKPDPDTAALARIERKAEARGMRAAATAEGWEAFVSDDAPEYLTDWQRGLVAGQRAMQSAILAAADAKEQGHG